MTEKKKLVRLGRWALCIGGVILFFRFLFFPLLPFLLAWGIAMGIRPFLLAIRRRTGLPLKLISFLSLLLLFLLLLTLMTALCGKAVRELRGIGQYLAGDGLQAAGELFDRVSGFAEKLPFSAGTQGSALTKQLRSSVMGALSDTVSDITARIPAFLMNAVAALPGTVLFTVVWVMATFYISADVERVNGSLLSLLPEKLQKRLRRTGGDLFSLLGRWIRAYLLILLITFTELLIGFCILRIPYALVLSAVIALIDILPVLGVGTVLVPWAVTLLLQKNTGTGMGLLILFGVIWVIRQIAEPKIVGRSVGLPPLVTLLAMYVGLRICGLSGLFLFPLGIVILKCIRDSDLPHG